MTPPKLRTRHVAIAAVTVFVGFAVWLLGGWSHGWALKAIDDLVIVGVSIAALVFSFLAARVAQGVARRAWMVMAASLVAWNVGQMLWTYYELVLRDIPFPSLADVFFLTFPILAGIALLLFWGGRRELVRNRIILDGLIVAGSLLIVSWLLVMGDIYRAGAASRLEFALALAYPVLDLVVVTIAAIVLVTARSGQRLVMTLLTLGLICIAVADSGYAYLSSQVEYTTGDLIDIGWVAGLLLLTVAGAAAREAVDDNDISGELPGWASVWLPYAPLMLAAGVLGAKPISATSSGVVLTVGLLLFVTVLARQYFAVKENRRLLEVVTEQAMRDPLTGLANRSVFAERLNHALRRRIDTDAAVGVLILDIDDFKLINDTLGHPAGDELLRQAGQRIVGALRPGETVARLGGDEFAVLLEGDPTLPEATARRMVDAFDEPVTVGERELSIRPSIGLAAATADRPELTADELLDQADRAMYAAKRSRLSRPRLASVETPETDSESFHLLQDLRLAVERGELELVYQPKFRLSTGEMIGVEALLRWSHPVRGALTPDDFLPLVRRHGLIEPVTDFVIDTALDDAKAWRDGGLPVQVAINLFPPSLAALQLPDRLSRALSVRGLDSSALALEITEDILLDDLDRTRRVLRQLRDQGISVAIDDFGSGYSALWYLRDLYVDQVKLDRNFVAPVATDPRAAAVATAVIDLAHVLLMKTVAEGVEDRATADWLRQHGCDIVQGYYFSAPVTAEQVAELEGWVIGVEAGAS